jgi:cytochrome c biogenesis protein CcmG/thiol:disulfide interchange protein DsbE
MMKALIAAGLALCISFSVEAQPAATHQGRKAPPFALDDIKGATVELKSALEKGPVLIDFWATWCMPCLEELAVLENLNKEYGPKGLTILAISVDNERSIAKVKPYARRRNYSFSVLLDPNSDVARRYYALTLPTTLIVDRQGYIHYFHTGYKKGDEQEARRIIDALLAR